MSLQPGYKKNNPKLPAGANQTTQARQSDTKGNPARITLRQIIPIPSNLDQSHSTDCHLLLIPYSGRKIIEILQKNPSKDPSKYDQDNIAHMRRVAAYCKRHLAQEEKAKQDTNSKSYKSLKNWGHDAQKS